MEEYHASVEDVSGNTVSPERLGANTTPIPRGCRQTEEGVGRQKRVVLANDFEG